MPLSKPQACKNMFRTRNWLPLLHLCTQSNLSQNTPHSDVIQQLSCFNSKLFWCRKCSFKLTFNYKSDNNVFSLGLQEALDALLFVSQSHPTSFLRCATKDWLMPTKAATLRVETPLLSCTKVWCFCSSDNGGLITTVKTSTNCTSHTMEPVLHNAHRISRHSQLRKAHTNVDVGRVATNKNEYCNPNHFNISYLTTLNPFQFLVSHLCNILLRLLLWLLHHFVLWFKSVDNGSRSWVYVQRTQFCS